MTPDADDGIDVWRQWIHDNRDIYLRSVVIDVDTLLGILKQREEARDHVDRLLEKIDEERDRR